MKPGVPWIATIAFFISITMPAHAQQTPSPGNGVDACTMVSKAEIEKIMGGSLSNGKQTPSLQKQGSMSSCDFAISKGGQISIVLQQTKEKYVSGSEKAKFEKAGMTFRYTQGLGSVAFFIDMSGLGTGLMVFRGDYDSLLITAMNSGPEQTVTPKLESLARILLERWK